MTFPAEVCVCERCHHRGTLALFRSTTPAPTVGPDTLPRIGTYAVVLCVGCADGIGLPRWFESEPTAAVAVRA